MTNILIIGDFMVDHYIEGPINRQSPEDSRVPIIDMKKQYLKPGGAGNLAVAMKKITGIPIDVLSIYPRDIDIIFGVQSYRDLFQKGISWLGEWTDYSACIIKTRIVNERTKRQLIRFDRNSRFLESDIDWVNTEVHETMSQFRKYDYIVVSDYCKGVLNNYILDILYKFEGIVFVDTKNPDLSIWDNIKNCIIKVNTQEWIKSNKRTRHPLIITRGASGAELIKDGQKETYPTNNEYFHSPNVIGAGDIFLSGFVVEYIKTKDFTESIRYANKVASDAVTRPIGE